MKLFPALLLSIPLLALAATAASDAQACGGCFVQQTENTQVTSHRMALSMSTTETTLWDQIAYAGDPSSFSWVLPIRGQVEIGLSSDALFETLDQLTRVTVASPQIQCPPSQCNGGPLSGGDGNGTSGGAGGGGGGVTVIASEVVGPYDTVQLQSTDPAALTNWLTMNGYTIPADIVPVINAYVNEGFNFLAMKLVPGQGLDSMQPVRVTTPGAAPVLPLRMVAAGTGSTTPITLWMLGEGRYEPTNFSVFTIVGSDLVWDWDSSSSNYAQIRSDRFATAGGKAWLLEAGEATSSWSFEDPLLYLAQNDPLNSGYADAMGQGAVAACQADLDKLYGLIPPDSLWITRIYGELARSALGTDLFVGASTDQSWVERYLQIPDSQTIGTPPACPVNPPCNDTVGQSGGLSGVFGNSDGSGFKGGGCAMNGSAGLPAVFAGAGLLGVLAVLRRRRRRF
jgi:hypothetical protein